MFIATNDASPELVFKLEPVVPRDKVSIMHLWAQPVGHVSNASPEVLDEAIALDRPPQLG